MCVCVRVSMRVYVFFKDTGESSESKYEKKKKKKKRYGNVKGRGEIRILVDRNYRATRIS